MLSDEAKLEGHDTTQWYVFAGDMTFYLIWHAILVLFFIISGYKEYK